LSIKCPGTGTGVSALSGGNQQKVVLAKCLVNEPRILLLDEPTRGVDVGAKRAIYDLIHAFVRSGGAVILVSSELEEVLGLADSVVVMRRGRLTATLSRDEATEERVLAAAFGTTQEGQG
jgi:ABC-type sugar transport system ATPase subunit